ncbi:MAG: molybdopterin-dependent oxidoreductase [Oligoflexales bacterium]|nr:molybdopterin-dependent oxidoreductase [Oligoflexales bacterium]
MAKLNEESKSTSHRVVGKNVRRLDAVAKVTGKAKYADDFFERDMLVGKVLRSPYAHARIRNIDASGAKSLSGVEAVITYRDLPGIRFATAGHPWSLDAGHRDVEDRLILTDKARFVGDAVAAVVASDLLTALKALKLIKVDYEVLEHVLDPQEAMKDGAPVIHDEKPGNIISSFGVRFGDVDREMKDAYRVFEGEFETSIVQHCHIENHTAYSYVDTDGRIVVVTATQVPHIVRRIVAQALGVPWGRVRVIKPYIGGGFGNKQDAVIEPLTAAMTLAVKGKPVRYALTREECFIDTRTRHAMKFRIKTSVSRDSRLTGIDIKVVSNNGAYASHGHSVAMSAGARFRPLYDFRAVNFEPKTVYTNLPVAGAMIVEKRMAAVVCSLEDIAMESFYDRIHSNPITSDTSANVRINAMSYGVTFAEVEVDMETGRIEVLEIYNVHDSGVIINPKLAEGQVHGGVSMGLGYALTEQMLFDKKTGKPLNNNLLDYKLQTILDTPRIGVAFVETFDAAGPFGNKSLGEPPVITPAPAIRNAVLDATGIAFNSVPMYPQVVFEKFRAAGLLNGLLEKPG